MSETKFTPGTWNIHPYDAEKNAPFVVTNEEGKHWVSFDLHFGPGNKIVGSVSMCTLKDYGWPTVTTEEETRANAHLIAAAPEMYEALSDVLKRIEESDAWWMACPDRGGFHAEAIEKLLAKARGES